LRATIIAFETKQGLPAQANPCGTPQQVLMIQNFADLALSGDRRSRAGTVAAATTTQHYFDAVWAEIARR
jgi:hypothetical protein